MSRGRNASIRGPGLLACCLLAIVAIQCRSPSHRNGAQTVAPGPSITSPAVRDRACGEMVHVAFPDIDVCIDPYESPGFEQIPSDVDYADADAACTARGARLCTEREWERACRGPQGLRFPYGDRFDPNPCNVSGPLVPTGIRNVCRSGYGVFDMSGNAAEWVAGGLLKGGDIDADEFAGRCGSRVRGGQNDGPGIRGFRCCRDRRTGN